jgi:hypothetical protein
MASIYAANAHEILTRFSRGAFGVLFSLLREEGAMGYVFAKEAGRARRSSVFGVRRVVASGHVGVCIRSINALIKRCHGLPYKTTKTTARSAPLMHLFDANARDEDAEKFRSMYQR